MKSFKISSSGNVSRSLGSTLAALNSTQLKVANFSVFLRTAVNAFVLVIFTLHTSTSIVLPAEFAALRMVSLSLERRVSSRDIKATLEKLFWVKREAVVTPMPGPLPMTRRPFDAMIILVRRNLYSSF